jgi:hypothetical protein
MVNAMKSTIHDLDKNFNKINLNFRINKGTGLLVVAYK